MLKKNSLRGDANDDELGTAILALSIVKMRRTLEKWIEILVEARRPCLMFVLTVIVHFHVSR